MKWMKHAVRVWCVLVFYLAGVQVSAAETSAPSRFVQGEPRIAIVMQRRYVDGEMSEETTYAPVAGLEKFLWQHKDWQIVDRDDMQLVLQKRIDDISPLLKTSGYFGVSKEGMLQIFYGTPEAHQAVHSFFQIDIQKLESSRRRQLQQGIRVESKEQYVEVLRELQPYSVKKD